MGEGLICSRRLWRRVAGVVVLSAVLALVPVGAVIRAEAATTDSATWEQFLADRPELLRMLAPPIINCFQQRDTIWDPHSPIFHGCIDWHSAVHAAYSHHAIYRRTGDRVYLDLVEQQIAPLGISLIPAESVYQQRGVDRKTNAIRVRENPYGFGWFLVLAREREQSTGQTDFREMANFAATEMIRWFQTRSSSGLEPFNYILQADHPNWSWSLINLDEWARYTNDDATLTAVREAATPLFDPRLDTECGDSTRDARADPGGPRGFNFVPPCLMRLAAVAHVYGHQAKNWIVARLPEGGLFVPPVTAPGDCHAGGLNFFRAYALYQIYLATGDTLYRDNYVELIRYHVSRPDLYAENYNCYAHWIAQVGVRAISLSYERSATAVFYTGVTTGDYHDAVALSARLVDTDGGGAALANRPVDLSLGSQGCSATTDSDGYASCEVTIAEPAGSYPVTASFAGDQAYLPSTATADFVVTLEETTLVYTGERVLGNGGSAALSAELKEDGISPIGGRAVTLALGSGSSAQSCTASTDASGTVSCTISAVAQANGPGSVSATFGGDRFYELATSSLATLVYDFAPGGGAFVIGDGNAPIGSSVTFWGAQWPKLNSLSGGAAPTKFKGYALDPSRPTCGSGWSTDPGNSATPPPAPLPAYLGVIVTSEAAQSGSAGPIFGNTRRIVVVKTDPGYDPNLGHAGTGTVTATAC